MLMHGDWWEPLRRCTSEASTLCFVLQNRRSDGIVEGGMDKQHSDVLNSGSGLARGRALSIYYLSASWERSGDKRYAIFRSIIRSILIIITTQYLLSS